MTPQSAVKEAVLALGSQAALCRRLSAALGRPIKGGHIYYWLNRGLVPQDVAPAMESLTSGAVRCEALRPDVTWHRDESGAVTGYTIPVTPATPTEKVA